MTNTVMAAPALPHRRHILQNIILTALGAALLAGTVTAAVLSGSDAPQPAASTPPAAAPTTAAAFAQIINGPLGHRFTADLARLSADFKAGRWQATQADAIMLINDSNPYLTAMRATPVPPAYQAARRDTIAGVAAFRDSAACLRDGIAAGDTRLIAQSQLLTEQGTSLFIQASIELPAEL
jgi:phosphate-selective porin